MGKASRLKRERRESLAAKLQTPEGRQEAHTKIVKELSKGSLDNQISKLSQIASTHNRKVKESIMSNAPIEMDKGIARFKKQGRAITVDNLLEEVRNNKSFLRMCENVGISYSWFEELANERIKVNCV